MNKIDKDGDKIKLGEMYLLNNLWGKSTGSGTQEIVEKIKSKSNIRWETSWNWDGPANTIKSYSAIVWGWHWGWEIGKDSLPIQFSAIKSMHTSWKYKVNFNKNSKLNITYDLWISDKFSIENENPSSEIMIWLYKTDDITPIGSLIKNIEIEGVFCDLWKGPHPVSGWPVYSFIRTVNTKNVSFNLVKFFNALSSMGLKITDYLIGVEAGTEIFIGSGKLTTQRYSLEVEVDNI